MNTSKCWQFLGVGLLLAGCATSAAPQRFELIDEQSKVHVGSYDEHTQGMTVGIGNRVYNGFFIINGESVSTYSSLGYYRHGYPYDSHRFVSSNTARAHLRSSDGAHLACEFSFESQRAVGSCRDPAGKVWQFVAGQ